MKNRIKIALIGLLLIFANLSIAQTRKVVVSDPPIVIKYDGVSPAIYATATSRRNKLLGKRHSFLESDSLGNIKVDAMRFGNSYGSSELLVSNLPTGFNILEDNTCLFEDGTILATWNVTGDPLVVRVFESGRRLVQVISTSPDYKFIDRGVNMLERNDITVVTPWDEECLSVFTNGSTGYQGLEHPAGFQTPTGFTSYLDPDGVTTIYTDGEVPDPDPDPLLACEDLGNPHSNTPEAIERAQHHYAIVSEAKVVGTVFSEGGEINYTGTWQNLQTLGYDAEGRRFAGYKINYVAGYENTVNPSLRTREGCPTYSDHRNLEYFTYNVNYKQAVSYSASGSPANLNFGAIKIASGTPRENGTADVYEVWFPSHNTNISIRINGGSWVSGTNQYKGTSTNQIPITAISIQDYSLGKDFRMDVSNNGGSTFDTYAVRRTSTGGHYTGISAIQRASDGRTYVSTTIGDIGVPSTLVVDGTQYNSGAFGDCFDIGQQSNDKVATFKFTDTNINWASLNLLIDYNAAVPVDNPTPDGYVLLPQQDVIYNTSGTVQAIKTDWQITESGSQVLLSDNNWATGFDTGTRRAFFGAEQNSIAGSRTLTNLDITDMQGMDIAPLVIYEGKKYSQSYIHVKANPSKNRRILQEGNKTYFWMPTTYTFDDGILPRFYHDFPNFTPPAGKIITYQFKFEDDHPNYYSNSKGVTNSPTTEYSKQHYYDYDKWAHDAGFPPAYSADASVLNNIIGNMNYNTFKNLFDSQVKNPHAGKGIVTLNFEVFKSGSGGDMNLDHPTLSGVIGSFHDGDPNALLSFWAGGNGGIVSNRILVQSQSTTSGMTPDLTFSGDFGNWIGTRASSSVFLGSWGIYRNVPDIYYTNDLYQARPNDYSWVHQAMMMTMMNKKFWPDKKMVWMDRHLIEYQITGPLDYYEIYDDARSTVYKYPARPMVSPGQMFTRAAFATAYADGIELWQEPLTQVEDPYYYGFGITGILGQDNLPISKQADGYPSRYKTTGSGNGAYVSDGRPQKNVDWTIAGVWAVSQNKDIVEAATSWQFIDFSTDGGSTWTTGNDCLPSETLVNKKPIAIFKKSANGSEGLLLFFNPFQDAITEQSYKIRVDGVVYDVFQVGDYASVVRIDI